MTAFWAQDLPPVERRERERSSQLHKLARCVDLLAEELDALELGDLPRLRDVAEKRATAEADLRSGASIEEGTPFHVFYTEAVTAALQRVDEWKERERLTRDELTHLRDESFSLVRSIPQGSPGGRYPVLEETGGQLNVRL